MPYRLGQITLIPAYQTGTECEHVPNKPGIYMFFLRGGTEFLHSSGYFALGGEPPLDIEGYQHLYTGAGQDLRRRLHQHLHRNWISSSFRTSLLAVEYARQAISRSGTPHSRVVGDRSLSVWLNRNAVIGYRPTGRPFDCERELIRTHTSPLNLTLRRQHPYSRQLQVWRSQAFETATQRQWYH